MSVPIFIVNPTSCAGKTLKVWKSLQAEVAQYFPNAVIRLTEHKCDAEKFIGNQVRQDQSVHIICVGGDGTINEVVNGVMVDEGQHANKVVLSFLPMGTGSDLTRSFGISRDPRKALMALKEQKPRSLDLWRAEYMGHGGKTRIQYFANMLSLGLGGHIATLANQQSKALGGTLSYLIATLRGFLSFKPEQITLKSQGTEIFSGSVSMVVFANGQYCGGGMHMSPDADLSDGKLHVILLEEMTKFQLASHFPKIYAGKHLIHPRIKTLIATDVEVSTQALLEMDGETPGRGPLKIYLGGTVQVI